MSPTNEDGEDEDAHQPQPTHEDHLLRLVSPGLGVDADADRGLQTYVETSGPRLHKGV
jgi:hypothetical protein